GVAQAGVLEQLGGGVAAVEHGEVEVALVLLQGVELDLGGQAVDEEGFLAVEEVHVLEGSGGDVLAGLPEIVAGAHSKRRCFTERPSLMMSRSEAMPTFTWLSAKLPVTFLSLSLVF